MVQKTGDDFKLSRKLGGDTNLLKRQVQDEITRALASGSSYAKIARSITDYGEANFRRSARIARTEGHRVQNEARMHSMERAKNAGADVVKQWDATLDDTTRESHAKADGEIREMDEKFSNGLMFPGDPAGKAAEVVNCRCAMLVRARWALDEAELKTLQERAEIFGLDKTDSFEDFKEKYLANVGTKEYNKPNERPFADRSMANSMRRSPFTTLSDEEIATLLEEADGIGNPRDVLQFNYGDRTGFSDLRQKINVRGDVMPDTEYGTTPRDTMSSQAVLAHEYYGHYLHHPTRLKSGDWRDEFRASYSAAINAPNLSDEDRRLLMLDALDRAREANVTIVLNATIRRILYGIDT